MNGDWSLIFRGFFVAGIGATSTILYIIAISAAFVGRFTVAGAAIAAGVVLAIAFLRLIGGYLDAIDLHVARETSQMKSQAPEPSLSSSRESS